MEPCVCKAASVPAALISASSFKYPQDCIAAIHKTWLHTVSCIRQKLGSVALHSPFQHVHLDLFVWQMFSPESDLQVSLHNETKTTAQRQPISAMGLLERFYQRYSDITL